MTAANWTTGKTQLAKAIQKPRFGLFSDLDGTLSPIAPTPDAAQITPRNRQLLGELAQVCTMVSLISGRRAASLQNKVGLPNLVYVGNHGLEEWVDGEVKVLPEALAYREKLKAARSQLQGLLTPGAYVEEKEATLSLHYRQAKDPREFVLGRGVQIANIAKANDLTLFTGKMVFELRPPIEVDKGTAFRDLAAEYKLDAALFLGDDISDLNALRMAHQLRADRICDAWGVGVQSEEAPNEIADEADYLATGVADVETLLAWVLTARKASST